MEKFFKVAEGAKPYADYELWLSEREKVNAIVGAFLDKHEIEAQKYFYRKDGSSGESAKLGDEKKIHFGVVPVGSDLVRLNGHLKTPSKDGGYYFKKSSPLYKEFAQMAIDSHLRRVPRPSFGGVDGYLNCDYWTSKSRIFMHEGVLYGAVKSERVGEPRVDGIIEISGGEFYNAFYKELDVTRSQREIMD